MRYDDLAVEQRRRDKGVAFRKVYLYKVDTYPGLYLPGIICMSVLEGSYLASEEEESKVYPSLAEPLKVMAGCNPGRSVQRLGPGFQIPER